MKKLLYLTVLVMMTASCGNNSNSKAKLGQVSSDSIQKVQNDSLMIFEKKQDNLDQIEILKIAEVKSQKIVDELSKPSIVVKKNENIEVAQVLCVTNSGYNRASFVLWFRGEAISKISVAGNSQKYCFEIGASEGNWDWKVSKGYDGQKYPFIGRNVTFW